jgi:hypothetical protein
MQALCLRTTVIGLTDKFKISIIRLTFSILHSTYIFLTKFPIKAFNLVFLTR